MMSRPIDTITDVVTGLVPIVIPRGLRDCGSDDMRCFISRARLVGDLLGVHRLAGARLFDLRSVVVARVGLDSFGFSGYGGCRIVW
jgi:hypothetical protein